MSDIINVSGAPVVQKKYWNECGVDEKLDRIREEIIRLTTIIERHNAGLNLLGQHHHNQLGQFMSTQEAAFAVEKTSREIYTPNSMLISAPKVIES